MWEIHPDCVSSKERSMMICHTVTVRTLRTSGGGSYPPLRLAYKLFLHVNNVSKGLPWWLSSKGSAGSTGDEGLTALWSLSLLSHGHCPHVSLGLFSSHKNVSHIEFRVALLQCHLILTSSHLHRLFPLNNVMFICWGRREALHRWQRS